MPVVHERRSGIPPWAWVAIILGLLLVIMVVWLVAAGTRDRTDQYGLEPTPGTAPTSPEPLPPGHPEIGARTDRDVNVYIEEREQARPNVIIIDRNQAPPSGEEYRAVDVPGEFNLYGGDWRAEQGALVRGEDLELVETGQRVEGKNVYAEEGDERPYDSLYIETSAGSDMYIRYESRS